MNTIIAIIEMKIEIREKMLLLIAGPKFNTMEGAEEQARLEGQIQGLNMAEEMLRNLDRHPEDKRLIS